MENDERSPLRWMDSEVNTLISIWGDYTVQLKFDGTVRDNEVYRRISNEMKLKGITRFTLPQIRTKIKNLKRLYRKEKDLCRRSGGKIKTSAHFRKIDEILGDRIACTPEFDLETQLNSDINFLDATDNEEGDAEIISYECKENKPPVNSPATFDCSILAEPGPSHSRTPKSPELCKSRWKSIPSRHLRCYSRSGSRAKLIKKLSANLAFVQPYKIPKKQRKDLEDDLNEDREMSQMEASHSREEDLVHGNSESRTTSINPPAASALHDRDSEIAVIQVKEEKEDWDDVPSESTRSRTCDEDINENEYLLFVRSLLPDLSKFNRKQSLTFKRRVLDILEEIIENK